MNYEIKYLKYKNKYLNIKNNFLGGAAHAKPAPIPIYCIDLLKNFLDENFNLTQDDMAILNSITPGPIDRIQITCNYELICEGKEPTGNILKLPEAIRNHIQQYITNPFLIDKTFEYLRKNYFEIYKKITGPDTWERRMKRIAELLKMYITKIIEQIPITEPVPLFWIVDLATIEPELAAKITKLYLFLIKNIIEYNTDGLYYTIILSPNDFSRPHFSIMPNTTLLGNSTINLNDLLYLLIQELQRIIYPDKDPEMMNAHYKLIQNNRMLNIDINKNNEVLFGRIVTKLFPIDSSKDDWDQYDYFMNYIRYEACGIFFRPMNE